jgi:iron complex transport system substrate-binding protein
MNQSPRIVSLAPTQTEILAALGLAQGHGLVGVSEDCDYPAEITQLPTFGTWYAPDWRRVVEAQPDLVCTFGGFQEDVCELLRTHGIEVYHSDPGTMGAAIETIGELAALTGVDAIGEALRGQLERRIRRVRRTVEARRELQRPRVLRIMHWQPLISVGPGAFQHDVIELAGGQNIMADGGTAYFTCDPGEARRRDPEMIFFCKPEIGTRLEADPQWQGVSAVRHDRIHLFDCGLTCRSGPRIVDMLEILAAALGRCRLGQPPSPRENPGFSGELGG